MQSNIVSTIYYIWCNHVYKNERLSSVRGVTYRSDIKVRTSRLGGPPYGQSAIRVLCTASQMIVSSDALKFRFFFVIIISNEMYVAGYFSLKLMLFV